MTEVDLVAELNSLACLPSRDEHATAVFEELARLVLARFPASEVGAEAVKRRRLAFAAKRLLAKDKTLLFTPVSFKRIYGINLGLWGVDPDSPLDAGMLEQLAYLGLKRFPIPNFFPDSVFPSVPLFWMEEGSADVDSVYVTEKNLPAAVNFLSAYAALVSRDQAKLREGDLRTLVTAWDKSGPAEAHRIAVGQGWDYVIRESGCTLVAIKDLLMWVWDGAGQEGGSVPWVLNIGDVAEVSIKEAKHDEVHTLEIPTLIPSSAAAAPHYAKSALIGGLLAGPAGALVGAALAADRAQGSRVEAGVKSFDFSRQVTDADVVICNRFLEGMRQPMAFRGDEPSYEFLEDDGYRGFLKMLQARIPKARTVRTACLAWAEKHGSLDQLDESSDEWIDAVASLDPELGATYAAARDRRIGEAAAASAKAADDAVVASARAEELSAIDGLRGERQSLIAELDTLGLALFGAAAQRKKVINARIGEINVATGAFLRSRFDQLGSMKGMTKAQIIEAVGSRPSREGASTAGKSLCEWDRTGFYISLEFVGATCKGVHERRQGAQGDDFFAR